MLKFESKELLKNQTNGQNPEKLRKDKAAKTRVSQHLPRCPLQPIFTSRCRDREERPRIVIFTSVLPPPPLRSRDRDCQKTSSRHPTRGRIDLWELLHHHESFPDVPLVVPLGPWVHDQ